MAGPGHFHWNELLTRDVEAAKAFYGKTLGWTFEAMAMPDGLYHVAKADGVAVGGIMKIPSDMPADVPPHWFAYIAVDDADRRAKAVTDAGGKIVQPAFDVPGVGRIVIVADATGAMVGLIAPA